MLLTALLVFDPSEEEIKGKRVEELVDLSEQILEQDRKVKEVVDLDFERVIHLGAGPSLAYPMKLSSRFKRTMHYVTMSVLEI